MISSPGQGQNARSNQGSDILTALVKSLRLDDRSSEKACHTNGCGSLDGPSDKECSHLKVRVHLHDDKEFHFPPGVTAVEPSFDANPRQAVHQGDRVSDDRSAAGRRLFRTLAFGVITPVMVGAAFAWQFYGDDQTKDMVRGWRTSPRELSPVVSTNFWPSSSDVAAELAFKTSDRVPTQDAALLQAATAIPSAQVSVALESSPELQHQLETVVSDVAVVRRIVERLAAVQEQMALDQNVRQKVSSPPHTPAAVPPRKYAPSIARSNVVAHSPSVPVRLNHPWRPTAPPAAPTGLHPRAPWYGQLLQMPLSRAAVARHQSF
jgi:hypothetical protein